MSNPRLPLDELANQIAMLCQECAFSGRLLYAALAKPMEALKSGRAPRALNLSALLEDSETSAQALRESHTELKSLAPQLEAYAKQLGDPALLDQVPAFLQECGFWESFLERSRILSNKLKLIADLEKLSPLGRAPIQDAWDEVQMLAEPRS
ncbi:MAG TPA: hypothetical protein VFW62_09300 [bacterium]|nr:hypothetical protein [bacterium]